MAQQTSFESLPEGLFLLYPENRAFIEGNSRRIAGRNPVWQIVSGLLVIILVGYLLQGPVASGVKASVSGTSDPSGLSTIPIIFAIFAVPLLMVLPFEIRSRLRNQRLVQKGTLIPGTVVSSKPSWLSSKQSMAVKFTFTTPDGRQCTGENTIAGFSFSDPGFTWPGTGTPVMVLYVDDRMFRML